MRSITKVLLLCTVVTIATTATLPSHITPCKRDDPNLTECATQEGRKALPELLKGVKNLKLPSFLPFMLPLLEMNVGNNLKIRLTDVVVNGIQDFILHTVDIDLKNHKIHLAIGFPVLNIKSTYDINGQILILPITGKGPANITYANAEFDYKTDANFETRNGKEYLKLTNQDVTLTPSRAYFQLDNLFNGDKRLGDEMNKFLDENWQDIHKELGPAVSQVVGSVASIITSALFEKIPYENILLK